MAQTSSEMIFERLGSLKAEVEGNREDMAELKALVVNNNREATASRKMLYESVDQLKIDMAHLNARVGTVAKQAERGMDVAAKVDKWEQQGKGILIAVGVSGLSITAATAFFFQNVVKWLKLQLGL